MDPQTVLVSEWDPPTVCDVVLEELPPQDWPELLVCEVLADWLPPFVLDPEVVEELVLLLLFAIVFSLKIKTIP